MRTHITTTTTTTTKSPLDNEDAGIADLATSRLLELETLLTSILVLPTVRKPRTRKKNMIMMTIVMVMTMSMMMVMLAMIIMTSL